MAATYGQPAYGQPYRSEFTPGQYGQIPPYEDRSSYHGLPPSYGHGPSYRSSSIMDFSIEVKPTSEKTVMASSSSKAQALYKEIIAKEKEYEKWKWSYSNSSSVHGEHGLLNGTEHRCYRLQIERDFLVLAQKVQKLHQEKARGAEYLLERIWTIMTSIHTAIEEDLTFLEKCLDDESKKKTSKDEFGTDFSLTLTSSRSEYSSLATRVNQFASMRKIFKRSDITLPGGKVCSLTVNAISLSYKLRSIERKLPDSEFVQGLKSFVQGIKDFFSPSAEETAKARKEFDMTMRAYRDPAFVSKHQAEMDRILRAQDMTNLTFQAWRRN